MKKIHNQFFKLIFILLFCPPVIATEQKDYASLQLALFQPLQLVDGSLSIKGIRANLFYGRNNDVFGVDLGVINCVDGSMKGVQFGIVDFIHNDVKGCQYGAVNIVRGTFRGLQAGFVNWTESALSGVQIGAYNFCLTAINGIQVGLFNQSDKARGIQFGVINSTDILHGIQVGLFNIAAGKETLKYLPIVNAAF